MRITIPLSDASGDALRRLAFQELRDPRMQAKLILERALHEAGALPIDPTPDHRPLAAAEAGMKNAPCRT